MNRKGNSANFFLYVYNGKKIKELFASTLNGIPVSVRCVSSIIVVLNAKFARLLAVHANKKDGEKRRNPTRVPCFPSLNTLKFNFYRILTVHTETSLSYTFQRYKSMVGKSTCLQVIPQQSTQNTANLPLQTYEKNQCTFFIVQHGRQL